jgi:hypothetical protein
MTYVVTLGSGLVDETGSGVEVPAPVEIRTVPRPRILSTSPTAAASDVAPGASISIRFSRPMEATSALAAFTASVGGRNLGGSRTLTDDGALLTFRPAAALPAGATVAVQIAATATSVDGVDLGADATLAFRVHGATVPTGTASADAAKAAYDTAVKTAEQERKAQAAEDKKVAEAAAAKAKKVAAAKVAAEKKAAAAAKKAAAAAEQKAAAAEKKAAAAAEKAKAKARAAAAKAAAEKEKRAKAAAEKKAAKEAADKAKADAKAKAKADDAKAKAGDAKAKSDAKPKSSGKPSNSAGGGTWAAVEAYYLGLINCARTGGVISRSGKCSGAGSRQVKPLRLDAGISSKVSRPFARKLATSGACNHFYGGSPSNRLRRAGYSSPRWAENLSCPSGMSASSTAVYSIRYFQNEKAWNGGHWRNLRNPQYDRVGIGIWAARGRVIIVTNFYKG